MFLDLERQRKARKVAKTGAGQLMPPSAAKSYGSGQSERRSGSRGAPADITATWQMVQNAYGEQLANDVMQIVKQKCDWSIAARRFLCWLHAKRTDRSKLLVCIIAGGDLKYFVHGANLSHLEVSQMLHLELAEWTAFLASNTRLRPLTVAIHGRGMASVLEQVGRRPGYPLLRFLKRTFKMFKPKAVSHCLGSLGWPEVKGLEGAVLERRCLEMVRKAAQQEFDAHEAWFRFGQSVLRADSPPSGVDRSAWTAIKIMVMSENRFWLANGESQFRWSNNCSKEIEALVPLLLDRGTWLRAGLPPAAADMFRGDRKNAFYKLNVLSRTAVSCLGATKKTSSAALILFCCATGWNCQTMQDLPANPFIMRTGTEYGLATSAFVASYKARARHDIVAFLERDMPLSGIVEEDAKALWKATAADFDVSGRQDGYIMLKKDRQAGLLDLLDRYRAMTDPIRSYHGGDKFPDHFFVYMTKYCARAAQVTRIGGMRYSGLLGRTDLTFQAIRKSFVELAFHETSSTYNTRAIAGHWSTGALIPHYLNSDDIKAEMDQAIRLFQNILQGLMVQDREDVATVLALPDDLLEWFQRLGTVSGIAASIGKIRHALPGPSRGGIYFDPTREDLRDLFLAHRSLRQAQGRMPPRRWRVQGLPLLACTKAIGQVLHSKGLGKSYMAVARQACRELADGLVVLPSLLTA